MPDQRSDRTKSGGAKSSAKPAATKPAVAKPAATKAATTKATTPAGVRSATGAPAGADEDNPLHKKLRLRPEDVGVVIAPPEDDDNPLLPLPKTYLVLAHAGDLASHEGQFDYIHVFARDRADLVETFPLLCEKLGSGGGLWISWMKQPSKRGGGGAQPGDLNENVIRRIGLTHGLVDVKVAALDRDWSALRLVHRKR